MQRCLIAEGFAQRPARQFSDFNSTASVASLGANCADLCALAQCHGAARADAVVAFLHQNILRVAIHDAMPDQTCSLACNFKPAVFRRCPTHQIEAACRFERNADFTERASVGQTLPVNQPCGDFFESSLIAVRPFQIGKTLRFRKMCKAWLIRAS